MARFFLLFLLCACSQVSAQPSLARNYTFLYDSCPDPVKNHIATRRIYRLNCRDTSNHNAPDTTIEFYDPDGKLTAVEERKGNKSYQDRATRHHFYYDQQGRIICDSTFNDDAPIEVTTYEHTPFKVVIHFPPPYKYGDEFPTRIINYDGYNNIISKYDVNHNGDTMYAFVRESEVFSWYVNYRFMKDSVLTIYDSIAMVRTPLQSWEQIFFYYYPNETDSLTTQSSNFYNTSGQKIVSVYLRDSILCDCTAYFYENNRLVNQERRCYEDWDNPTPRVVRFRQYTTYTYRADGQLLQKREYGDDPDGITITNYVYNEKGLRVEENVVYEYLNERPVYIQHCERWEYTYY